MFVSILEIKAPMSEKAKEWLSKMKREGKFWLDELKNFKETK